MREAVIKLDLSKAFDRVNWLYIRMLLIHLGFGLYFVNWIMACLNSVSFSILLNGSATDFFQAERGIRQGCPLSPLLFLLVAESISHFLTEAKVGGRFSGIKISNGLAITHLLFVDDILIFCDGLKRDADILTEGLTLFKLATSMIIIIGRITPGRNQQLNIFRPSSLSLVPCLELFVCFIGLDIDIVFFF
jgi:hypothetical protein